ncbi:hypothetical protein A9R05_44725 (plasmid) [Burkholderia sp. KK1]|uniref:DUF3150 domain-containing protein n=1 Tax=Burkholderia sp. M701 TaxID=326454 RepID=V5YPG1_9BURK|nr:DUF3150 domain-containing protein [Burkholderia sp. M701]AQH06045.1 hypothetical protein A9R05_44725 [Burkholderia sp. KK1]BAO19292.1 protein of unknown function DUF3150 [Burkholderia sp. M701]
MSKGNGNKAGRQEFQVLNDVALFDFIVAGATGESTAKSDDFIREVHKLLPKDALSWVSKYRGQAKREILKVGVTRRVNNRVRGYFVPISEAKALSELLKAIKQDFLAEKSSFLAKYPKIVEDWANEPVNQTLTPDGGTRAEAIRKDAPKAEELEKRLFFDLSAIHIQSTAFFGEDDTLYSEVRGMVGQAATEIAEDVSRTWSGPAKGRTSSRVLRLIKRVRNKAHSMSILSPKFGRLADLCDAVMASVPQNSNIEGVHYLVVSALLSRCTSPKDILSDDMVTFDPLDVESPEAQATTTTAPAASSPVTDADQLAQAASFLSAAPQSGTAAEKGQPQQLSLVDDAETDAVPNTQAAQIDENSEDADPAPTDASALPNTAEIPQQDMLVSCI